MVDFIVAFLLGICIGAVIQWRKDSKVFDESIDRLNHTRKNLVNAVQEYSKLEHAVEAMEHELNEFSEEEAQRFWDKLLGFEWNEEGGKGHG